MIYRPIITPFVWLEIPELAKCTSYKQIKESARMANQIQQTAIILAVLQFFWIWLNKWFATHFTWHVAGCHFMGITRAIVVNMNALLFCVG